LEKKNKVVAIKDVDRPQGESRSASPLQAPLTASSYSGIFHKIGLPIPRSARVKVDYDLVNKDPTIAAQLKEIIQRKERKGAQIMEEGRKLALITERTYHLNQRRLEKWVTASYNRIDERIALKNRALGIDEDAGSASRKEKMKTGEELLKETNEERQRLSNLMSNIDDRLSVHSGTRRSARA